MCFYLRDVFRKSVTVLLKLRLENQPNPSFFVIQFFLSSSYLWYQCLRALWPLGPSACQARKRLGTFGQCIYRPQCFLPIVISYHLRTNSNRQAAPERPFQMCRLHHTSCSRLTQEFYHINFWDYTRLRDFPSRGVQAFHF